MADEGRGAESLLLLPPSAPSNGETGLREDRGADECDGGERVRDEQVQVYTVLVPRYLLRSYVVGTYVTILLRPKYVGIPISD